MLRMRVVPLEALRQRFLRVVLALIQRHSASPVLSSSIVAALGTAPAVSERGGWNLTWCDRAKASRVPFSVAPFSCVPPSEPGHNRRRHSDRASHVGAVLVWAQFLACGGGEPSDGGGGGGGASAAVAAVAVARGGGGGSCEFCSLQGPGSSSPRRTLQT